MTAPTRLEVTIPVRAHCADCKRWQLCCPWCGEHYGGIVGGPWYSPATGYTSGAWNCRGCNNRIKILSCGFTYAPNDELLATASTLSDSLEKLAAALALPAAAGAARRHAVPRSRPAPD